jgi:hypothetical protein
MVYTIGPAKMLYSSNGPDVISKRENNGMFVKNAEYWLNPSPDAATLTGVHPGEDVPTSKARNPPVVTLWWRIPPQKVRTQKNSVIADPFF